MIVVNCRPVAIDATKVNFIEPPKAVKLSQSSQLLLKNVAMTIMLVMLAGQLSAYTVSSDKWATPQITFNVDVPGANGLWNTAFAEAASQWSTQTPFNFLIVPTYGDPCRNPNFSGPRINGVAFESTECGDSWGELTLAITTFWSVGDNRIQAGIAFNSNLSWNVYSGPQVGNTKEFRRIALHELGHALGLNHEEDVDSIMAPVSSNIESLTADDIAGVNSIYGASTPDSFQFEDYLDVPTATLLASNAIIVTGIDIAAAITVGGDLSSEYSINGAAFTNIPGAVNNNDSVRVRHTSSLAYSTSVSTLLTVGGVGDTFTTTTLTTPTFVDSTPDSFQFEDYLDVPVATLLESNAVIVTGIDIPATITVGGDLSSEYSINGAAFTNIPGAVNNNDSVRVRHTSSLAYSTSVSTLLTVGGVRDTFTTTTLTTPDVADNDGTDNGKSGGGGGGALDTFSLFGLCLLGMSGLWHRRIEVS